LFDITETKTPSADSGRVPSFHYEAHRDVRASLCSLPLRSIAARHRCSPLASLGRLPTGLARSSLAAEKQPGFSASINRRLMTLSRQESDDGV
jgi:hypothetical protein